MLMTTATESAHLAADQAITPRRKRVLIVDDNPTILDLLYAFMARMDCDIRQADDGSTALEMFRRDTFDLVITDLVMPVMDGYTLLAEIKRLRAHTPVVVITGHVNFTPEQADSVASAVEVLYKPFDLKELRAIVEDALTGS